MIRGRWALQRLTLRAAVVLLVGAAVFSVGEVPSASATVVERIVAVVGERAILLSDLRERARPFVARIEAEVPPGAQRAGAISNLYKRLLERMVEEELQLKAANRARITVTSKEIDDALGRVAAQNRVSVEALLQDAARSGLSERQYREEVRRQLVEAKLLNLRVQGRVRVTEEDLRAAYRAYVGEERAKLKYHAAWIVLPYDDGSVDAPKQREAAQRIAQRARAGADFATLAQEHSNEAQTRARGGDLGWQSPGKLPAPLERALRELEDGQVSPPVRVGSRLVVLKLIEREESELPSYDEARGELAERVYLEKMGKARQSWIDGLKRRSFVHIRL